MLLEPSTTDGVNNTSTERQVGMKSKREENEEGEDVEWEEAPPAGNFILFICINLFSG